MAKGKVLAPARDLDQMRQVVLNDYVDAALAVLFVGVVVSMVVFGIRSCLEAWRADTWTAHEAGGAAPRPLAAE